jgi:hypothetical protein
MLGRDAMHPLKIKCLSVALFSFAAAVATAQTIDQFRNVWIDGVRTNCVTTQRASSENQRVTDGQIAQYCDCVARHSAEVITIDEVFELHRTGQRPPDMQKKLNAMGETCVEVILGRVKDGPIKPQR